MTVNEVCEKLCVIIRDAWMDKDIANKEEMHFAADIVALDDQDYSDEIMEETLFEVPENEHELKTFMYETWKNISMETAVYYWMEDEDYTDDYDNEDNEDYPDEMKDMNIYPNEMEDIDDYPDDMEDIYNYPDEMEDMNDFLDEIWKKTVMETEIYFGPIDFGSVTSRPTLETIPEEDEEEDGFEDYNEDSQDIGYSEMDTDIKSGYDNISEWKKTVTETEIYFWPIDFGKYKFCPTLEIIPEEDEEEDGFEDYNGDSQDIGYSEMDTDKESGYDNISEMEDEDYMDDNDNEDNEEYPDEMEDMNIYPDEMEDFDDYPDDMEDMANYPDDLEDIDNYLDEMEDTDDFLDEIEDMDAFLDEIYFLSRWKKTVMETEIYFWPIDFGKLTSLPTLETIPEEDEEEDGFEDYNADSQDIGYSEMDTDIKSGYDNISEWKKTVMETEIYFRPIDFGKYKFWPTLETIPEEDEEEDGFEDYNGDSQDIGYSEMDTDTDIKSGYDNISEMEDEDYMDDNEDNEEYPDEMKDMNIYPDEMEDIDDYPDDMEDIYNYPDEMEDMNDFLDEIWKKTVMETEIYFGPIDFGKLTSLPTLETIPEEDEEEDGFEDYNGDSQDIGHCEMDTDKESGYDNISGANNYYSRLCNYPDEMEDISNYPDEMEDIYNYPEEIEDMDNYPDEMEDMDDFLDEIWKKTVTETEIYFRPIDFGDFTFRTTLETILEEEEKVIEEGDEARQNMGRVKMKTQADKDELENASRSYRQWRRLLRFFRETFSCCSIQTSE
ncbi:uncharacterized protein ACNLHF_000322 [Anomaloglossus baeobatrachus]|uniref:uncharacterized protein LOC142311089 n=1 Tax=Anomaloglossus baeobatrachus TaxID=238106 RepID=UPI003F4F87FA